MKNIYLDGEAVLFDGPLPADMPTLQALLNQHLSAQNRMVNRWVLDGIDNNLSEPQGTLKTFSKIEAFSAFIDSSLSLDIQAILNTSVDTLRTLSHFGHRILSHPWSTQAPSLGLIIQKLMPLVQLLGHLESIPELAPKYNIQETLHAFDQVTQEISQSAKQQDLGALSETVFLQLIPLYKKTLQTLKSINEELQCNQTTQP